MRLFLALLTALFAVPAAAQLTVPGLPGIGQPRIGLPEVGLPDPVEGIVRGAQAAAMRALEAREARIADLVRLNPLQVDLDLTGEPARRGELLLTDPSPAELGAARRAGFVVVATERLEELDLAIVRLAIPEGVSLGDAQRIVAAAAPGIDAEPDHIHFQAGSAAIVAAGTQGAGGAIGIPVGVIDGGARKNGAVIAQKGFARGAPLASNHGSAVTSLLGSAGVGRTLVADVYGTDPAGGNALAIARALDWLAQNRTPIATISLVGPRNAVLEKAIARARGRGMVIVAAVGNDGPAAPPAYPASYPGVVAVTAVDGRLRPLIEAGRAAHLDYAAPGADIRAFDKNGKRVKVRGTSYAAPLVAARLAAALGRGESWRAALDGEAQDLGPRGPDATYGRGLLCRRCAR